MFIVISPAKKLDFDALAPVDEFTQPRLLAKSAQLIDTLRELDAAAIKQLMKISDNLAELNLARFAAWQPDFNQQNAKQALFAFKGDVYAGMNADNFSLETIARAQHSLRILSGLYGLLRPLDLIMPYRLEMGTRLADGQNYQNLYQFWGASIAKMLSADMQAAGAKRLINLASAEYFKVLAPHLRELGVELIHIEFREKKQDGYQIIGIYAKRARGLMCNYILQNDSKFADLAAFDWDGYQIHAALSSDAKLVFCRD